MQSNASSLLTSANVLYRTSIGVSTILNGTLDWTWGCESTDGVSPRKVVPNQTSWTPPSCRERMWRSSSVQP